MEIYLAHTQGFCAGVTRAITTLEKALAKHGSPFYVFHQIVHNTTVIKDFEKRGVIFVEDINEVPNGSYMICSAHGVAPDVVKASKNKHLKLIDATCPLVERIHKEAIKFSDQNIDTVLIGYRDHQEMIGTAGYVKSKLLHFVESEKDIEKLKIGPKKPVGYLTQTTLSVREADKIVKKLREMFFLLMSPPQRDICYATQNRQDAIRALARICDMIIICGSPNSSNSNRLREIGEHENIPTYMVDNADEFDIRLLKNKTKVGISSGASVPQAIVDGLIKKIRQNYPDLKIHQSPSPEKKIIYRLPRI